MAHIRNLFLIACLLLPALGNAKCLSLHVIQNEPLGYIVKGRPPAGVHWEYLEAIEKESGICINKLLMPYPRIWKSIEQGNHDGGIVFTSPTRMHLVKLVGLIREVKTVVIASPGKLINSYNDLYDLTIGKTRGTHLSEQFDNDKKLIIVNLTNYEQAAQMINKGRIDAIAGSAPVLSYQLFVNGVRDNLDFSNKVNLGAREQWLQLSKKSKNLNKSEKLAKSINNLTQNGTFDRIMERYYGSQWKIINK